MDKKILMKIGHALRDAEIAVDTMVKTVDPDSTDPYEQEIFMEMVQIDGALMEFDRFLASFSLPVYEQQKGD